jgi:hypothetical protein
VTVFQFDLCSVLVEVAGYCVTPDAIKPADSERSA